jgi:excisionase family DNA binding protein
MLQRTYCSMPKSELLLTNEVAQLLGVSPETIRLWERLGRLPALRTAGGMRLFDRGAVERFAEQRAAGRTESIARIA